MLLRTVVIIALALAAASFADPVPPRSIILSNIIGKALESLRPSLKDLAIPSLSTDLEDSKFNLTVSLDDGIAEKLEKFTIFRLDTSLVPLSVTNLTIILDEVKIKGRYSMEGRVAFPDVTDVTPVSGKGNAKIELKRVFATIAGKFLLSGNKIQIAPKGLYDFDLYVGESKFQLENLCGGGDEEKSVNKLFSAHFPGYVEEIKKPLFDKYRDPIIDMINQFLSETNLLAAGSENVIDC